MDVLEYLSAESSSVIMVLVLAFITVIIPLLLNERWKRMASLAERLWSMKYDGLTMLLKRLWDLGELMSLAIQFGGEINRRYTEVEKRFIATMYFWREMNSKFMMGKGKIKALESASATTPVDDELVRSIQMEARSLAGMLINSVGNDTERPMLQLKLVVADESILKEAQEILEFTADTFRRVELNEDADLNESLDKFRSHIRRYGDRARMELEKTRMGRHSIRPRHKKARDVHEDLSATAKSLEI